MKSTRISAVAVALLLLAVDARSDSAKLFPKVGEEYDIITSYETSSRTNGTSSGSSRGRNMYVERVIGARDGGLEMEYDLPSQVPAEARARVWQFSARVFRPSNGPMQLINRAELEMRVDTWLSAAGLPHSACGGWYFTWNAFRVECDPETIIETIHTFDLLSVDLREGALYQDPLALSPGKLTRTANGPNGPRFAVVMEVDPDAVRRARAESDVIAGEIMQTPVTLDAALHERAREAVSGTIEVTFDADAAGNAWRRTKVTRLQFDGPGKRSETETATETVERRLVSGSSARQ